MKRTNKLTINQVLFLDKISVSVNAKQTSMFTISPIQIIYLNDSKDIRIITMKVIKMWLFRVLIIKSKVSQIWRVIFQKW